MRRFAPLLIPLFVAAASADDLSASKAKPGPPEAAMIQQLGVPADEESVHAALRALDRNDTEGGVKLGEALGRCGGAAAASGLVTLVRHRSSIVRVAALKAAAAVDLRDATLLERTRIALRAEDIDTLRAACVAIGAIGDGTDVEHLFDLMAREDDVETKSAAYKALRSLSQQRIAPVHARWTYWWRTAHRRATTSVARAVEALDAEPGGDLAMLHESTLVRSGWIKLELVDETIRRWLTAPDKVNRARACRLAAHFGLVARIAEIRPLTRFAFDRELSSAVRDALTALGVPEPTDRPR